MKKKAPKKVFAHGAIKSVCIDDRGRGDKWVFFGASVSGGEAYPVCFELKNVPELIEWLQYQVDKEPK